MAKEFTQIVGELRFYEEDVIGDTILSAVWSSDPTGPTVSDVTSDSTKAIGRFQSNDPGEFVLTVEITTAGGQILKGQARINVIPVSV